MHLIQQRVINSDIRLCHIQCDSWQRIGVLIIVIWSQDFAVVNDIGRGFSLLSVNAYKRKLHSVLYATD